MLHEEWILGTITRLGHVSQAVSGGSDVAIGLTLTALLEWTGTWGEWTAATTNDERTAILERAGL